MSEQSCCSLQNAIDIATHTLVQCKPTCRRENPQFHFSFKFSEGAREGRASAERLQSNCKEELARW